MDTPEGKVKKEIKAFLESIGAWYFMPVQTGYGRRTLDFLGCYRGRFFAIEAKRGDRIEKPAAFQALEIHEILSHGGLAFMAQSVDDVKMFFTLGGLGRFDPFYHARDAQEFKEALQKQQLPAKMVEQLTRDFTEQK